VPIVPVTIIDAWQVLWDDGLKFGSKPGNCHIFVHKPIDTSGLGPKDADDLKQRVFETIKKKL